MYLHDWSCKEDLISDFQIKENELQDINILLASYNNEKYSGDAFVLFEKEGKFYEVNGSHCSCYGLEGQWEPEETDLEVISYRLEKGFLGRDRYSGCQFSNQLKEILFKLKQ